MEFWLDEKIGSLPPLETALHLRGDVRRDPLAGQTGGLHDGGCGRPQTVAETGGGVKR